MYLILENGTTFEGSSFGYEGEAIGVLVFATGMTGYLETLTDPSCYGQIIVQTFPLIGNYGIIPSDFESGGVHVNAYIVRDWCQEPSNFRCEGELDTFLRENKIPGLCGIDTRALTKIVREHGEMNVKLSHKPELTEAEWEELKSYRITDSVAAATCKEKHVLGAASSAHRILLWDFGSQSNIERELLKRECQVIRVPAGTTAEEIADIKPDGIVLSNGPGDPAENVEIIEEIKKVCKMQIPMFGICLGHQLLALANGAKTEKLPYGHRGGNQPVLEAGTNKAFITSQNHSYTVAIDSLPDFACVSYINGNDGSCEGIRYHNMPIFTVQFYPEAATDSLNPAWLFDRFIDMVKK